MARVYVENERVVLEGFAFSNEITGGGLFIECPVILRSCQVQVGMTIEACTPAMTSEIAHERAGSIAREARKYDDEVAHNILPLKERS